MYLFTRSRRVDPGEFVEAMEWAVDIIESVKPITGHEVDAWTAFASPELGTVVWSMMVETMVDIAPRASYVGVATASVRPPPPSGHRSRVFGAEAHREREFARRRERVILHVEPALHSTEQ